MILIGLGSNLPGKYETSPDALRDALAQFPAFGVEVSAASSVWRSAPVPVSDQPWYCNAVCAVETALSSSALLRVLMQIEAQFGRVRGEVNASRTLDLDILAYNQQVIDQDGLTLPHPRLHERAFVLYPLQEIATAWVHPSLGKSMDDMLADMPAGQEIQRLEDYHLL